MLNGVHPNHPKTRHPHPLLVHAPNRRTTVSMLLHGHSSGHDKATTAKLQKSSRRINRNSVLPKNSIFPAISRTFLTSFRFVGGGTGAVPLISTFQMISRIPHTQIGTSESKAPCYSQIWSEFWALCLNSYQRFLPPTQIGRFWATSNGNPAQNYSTNLNAATHIHLLARSYQFHWPIL